MNDEPDAESKFVLQILNERTEKKEKRKEIEAHKYTDDEVCSDLALGSSREFGEEFLETMEDFCEKKWPEASGEKKIFDELETQSLASLMQKQRDVKSLLNSFQKTHQFLQAAKDVKIPSLSNTMVTATYEELKTD